MTATETNFEYVPKDGELVKRLVIEIDGVGTYHSGGLYISDNQYVATATIPSPYSTVESEVFFGMSPKFKHNARIRLSKEISSHFKNATVVVRSE